MACLTWRGLYPPPGGLAKEGGVCAHDLVISLREHHHSYSANFLYVLPYCVIFYSEGHPSGSKRTIRTHHIPFVCIPFSTHVGMGKSSVPGCT